MGGTSGPGPGSWRGYSGPQFSGRLEDLREFKRSWDEYERQYFPKKSEEVLMEILHTQALGPKARKAGEQAHSLGTTWTYLEDHLREQRERIDNLLSDTLRAGEPVGPEELYLYYKKVCQFLDTEEGQEQRQRPRHHGPAGYVAVYAALGGDLQVGTMGWGEASGGYTLHVLRLLPAAHSGSESTDQVAGRSRGRGPSHGLALRLPKMAGTLHTGGYMWKLPHAGGVPNV
jgi:hypothetical protein